MRAFQQLARQPVPQHVEPMKARLGTLPRDDDAWGYEVKWDGIRAICHLRGGQERIESRLLNDVTHQYPELRGLAAAVGRTAVLDGEIVALDDDGRPSFQRLQARMGVAREADARMRMARVPVDFLAFDVLYLDDRLTMALPYAARRELLGSLGLEGEHWHVPAMHAGDGAAMLAATRERGLEGLLAKRLDSVYEPGRRSGAWLKVKNWRSQEVVIGGWTPGEGHRRGGIGALVAGYYRDGRLVCAGKVGTGFTERMLADLEARLAPLARPTSPFQAGSVPANARFVEPRLVAEVAFSEWTRDGTLRQPAFKGLRADKLPHEVVREEE